MPNKIRKLSNYIFFQVLQRHIKRVWEFPSKQQQNWKRSNFFVWHMEKLLLKKVAAHMLCLLILKKTVYWTLIPPISKSSRKTILKPQTSNSNA